MPAKKPKKTYRTLQEPATHGRFDREEIRRVLNEIMPQKISDPRDNQESLALQKILDRSKKNLKEGKAKPLRDAVRDIRAKAKQLKPLPKFKTKAEERKFWENHDSFDYLDWSKAIKNPYFWNLKPSLLDRITVDPASYSGQPTIRNLRIPVSLIIKLAANGLSAEEIVTIYPELETADIFQSLHFAARLISEISVKSVKTLKDLRGIIRELPKLGKDAKRFKDLDHLAGTWSGKDAAEFHKNIKDLESFVEIPDAEVIESGGDIIIIPVSNRPRAYKKLLALATKVMGDKELATLWLYETQFGLDDARPVDRMRTASGAKEVESLLLRLEYGDCL